MGLHPLLDTPVHDVAPTPVEPQPTNHAAVGLVNGNEDETINAFAPISTEYGTVGRQAPAPTTLRMAHNEEATVINYHERP